MKMTVEFDLEKPGNRIMVIKLFREFEGLGLADAFDKVKAVEAGDAPADITAPDNITPQPPTPRQAAAAAARAAKAAKTPGPVEQVLGPVDQTVTIAANGAVEDDDLGLTDPNMSPAEAKEAGLALVREVYAAGKVKQVKDLQKEWQVAKFYDVPQEQGHAFYQRVVKMAVETGVRK